MRPILPNDYESERTDQERRNHRTQATMSSQFHSNARRSRPDESWIEISAQPSASALSSTANNDIITTGLNVSHHDGRRSRQVRVEALPQPRRTTRSASVAGSSQDEYEESESESDQVLSSSNEDISQAGDDEDDTSTALGVGDVSRNVFTPQPHAFSQPPSANNSRPNSGPDSYFPHMPPVNHSDRLPSNRMITQRTLRPVSREQSTITRVQPDHDAALRASLTTLLSCAAAVRSPKEQEVAEATIRPNQPTALRLIPESQLDAVATRSPKPFSKRRSREASKERHAKKARASKQATVPVTEEMVSPTMMTWMISAGVVIVFSAISFSAGYAWGKDVGHIEGQMAVSCGNCGQEALRVGGGGSSGLRKLRWTAAAQSVRA